MIKTLKSWMTPTPNLKASQPLYAAIIKAARQEVFYTDMGVPDTLDGRFEMICLHLCMLMKRLKNDPSQQNLDQDLVDLFFMDMDNSLREMGAGDMGVGPRIKVMAQGFYGRLHTYDKAIDSGEWETALRKNVYGTHQTVAKAQTDKLTAYVNKFWNIISLCAIENLTAGEFL